MSEMTVTRAFNINNLRSIIGEQKNCKRIEGHAAVFGQVVDIGGYFDEVIEREAFNECDFSDVLMCVNHDLSKVPLARSKGNSPSSTLHLNVDEYGLAIKADLDIENNQDSRTVVSAIERGDIDGMSFIFRISENVWERLDTEKPLRRITKISKVFEAGPVNMPAYSSTDIYSRDKSSLETERLKGVSSELEKERLRTQIILKSIGAV